MSDKFPVIYKDKLPSYKLQKEDLRPKNNMFPQIIATQSLSKHIKNKNNLAEQKSESSDVKRLRNQIEKTDIDLQNERSRYQKLHKKSEDQKQDSQYAAKIMRDMVMANYYLGCQQQTNKLLTNSLEREKILVKKLGQLQSLLQKLLQEKRW